MSGLKRIAQGGLLLGAALGIFLLALLAALGDAATVSQTSPCPPPVGWAVAQVPTGASLPELAQTHSVSVNRLLQANCLSVAPDPLPGRLNLPQTEAAP